VKLRMVFEEIEPAAKHVRKARLPRERPAD